MTEIKEFSQFFCAGKTLYARRQKESLSDTDNERPPSIYFGANAP